MGKPRTILVIDDEPENRDVLGSMLEPLGFQVVTADTGQAGLLAARHHTPDVIITDVMMPEMDGLEMTRHLRQQSAFANTPIIASPATLSRVKRQESLEAGCTAFLPKPIDLNALLQELHYLMDLDWIYEDASPLSDSTDLSTLDCIVPPPTELKQLYESAKSGFIRDVQQEAERLKQLNASYAPFANKLLVACQQIDDG